VGNRHILLTVLTGLVGRVRREPASLRHQLLKSLWIEVKRFSAPHIRDIEVSDLSGIESFPVHGAVTRHCPLILAALSQALDCKTIFEIGTYHGETAWLLAHNCPAARIFTLDLPALQDAETVKLELTDPEYFIAWERGRRFRGTPEATRITQLFGDSATFDFSPYYGGIDLVYIDASHSYSYVRSDTEAALRLLSPQGTIVWDDYTYYPGIYAYLNQLSPQLDNPILHVRGTRFAIYSRSRISSSS
jgi:predicted O-methyltransferase YrrM